MNGASEGDVDPLLRPAHDMSCETELHDLGLGVTLEWEEGNGRIWMSGLQL